MSDITFFAPVAVGLCLGEFLDSQLSAIVATSTTNGVVDIGGSAVGAYCQSRHLGYVMSTTFRSSGVRLFSFRMCHNVLLFENLMISRFEDFGGLLSWLVYSISCAGAE